MHVFVEPASGTALPRVEVATLEPVPRGQTTVEFTIVEGVNLLPYVESGARITATATGMQPMRDFRYDGRLVIEIRI